MSQNSPVVIEIEEEEPGSYGIRRRTSSASLSVLSSNNDTEGLLSTPSRLYDARPAPPRSMGYFSPQQHKKDARGSNGSIRKIQSKSRTSRGAGANSRMRANSVSDEEEQRKKMSVAQKQRQWQRLTTPEELKLGDDDNSNNRSVALFSPRNGSNILFPDELSSSSSSDDGSAWSMSTLECELTERAATGESYSEEDVLQATTVHETDDEETPAHEGKIYSRWTRFTTPSKGNKNEPTSREKKRSVISDIDDLDKYMARREMTPTQERWNALTMIPSPLYCLYFILSGHWIRPELVQAAKRDLFQQSMDHSDAAAATAAAMESSCWNHAGSGQATSWWWQWYNMPCMPPLPLLAAAVAIIVHAPFSFLYHWRYAHALTGTARTYHWSRRLDQAFIHVASAFMSYATSGSLDFFFVNVLFNADCFYRQFKHTVLPRRNQVRILISVVAYTIPILRRALMTSDTFLLHIFIKLWMVFAVSFWLFGLYPIGGWSHSAFHLVIALAPSLVMTVATLVPASAPQMEQAANCMAWQSLQQGLQQDATGEEDMMLISL